MTLYRYIPSKAELLDLMLDRVNQPAYDELPAGWRPAMEAMGRELWRLCTVHRWLPLVDQARPVLGPNAVRALDLVMGALHGCGLTDREKIALAVTIESFVTTLARTANAVATAQARTGVSHDEFWQSQETALVAAMESGRYPHMAGLSDDVFEGSSEEHLEFGLTAILDGVQVRLDARAASGAASSSKRARAGRAG
jgi:AcrR family transcriptional regulator